MSMDPNGLIQTNTFTVGSYIPQGMLAFAFFASLIWTILKIIELVNSRPGLQFKITREFFLRIFENGECFYTNAVLVAYNAGALVESVEVKLKKENGSTKNFDLYVVSFGEKVRAEAGVAGYYFHSTSPICLLPDSMPQRITYLCSQEHYAEAIRRAYRDFKDKILELKQRYPVSVQAVEQEELVKASQEVGEAIEEACTKIVDSVQIEPGNYELCVSLTYRQRGRLLPFYSRKRAESAIRFVVEPKVRDVLRWQVNQYVRALGRSLLFDERLPVITPEYIPIKINEVT